MPDVFDETVATYRDEAGAAAFVAKERKFEDGRNGRVYALFDAYAMQGWRILDVGCGFGRDVREFRRRGAKAYGCDVSEPLLEHAEREVGPYFTRWDVRSGDEVPFGGGFDFIWCCALLVHVPREELAGVLEKLWQGLRTGGRLAIITKCGEGQAVTHNLGEGLGRVMVMYEVPEITDVLTRLGAEIEVADGGHSATAFGEALLAVWARKV